MPILLGDKLSLALRRQGDPWPEPFPMFLLLEHHRQAERNHGQSLSRLAERGGLAPSEILAIMEDRPWSSMEDEVALERLQTIVEAWLKEAGEES